MATIASIAADFDLKPDEVAALANLNGHDRNAELDPDTEEAIYRLVDEFDNMFHP
jgi:hypothetical protein